MFSSATTQAVLDAEQQGRPVGHATARAIVRELCDYASADGLTIPSALIWFVADGSYSLGELDECLDAATAQLGLDQSDSRILRAFMQYTRTWARNDGREAQLDWANA